MKKYFKKILFISLSASMLLTGCGNREIIDTTYSFERAIIKLPDGEIVKGKVDKWADYDSDTVQVTIDGKTYLTHYNNVVLISE